MKGFTRLFLFTIALTLVHVLFYTSERMVLAAHSDNGSATYGSGGGQKCDEMDFDLENGYKFHAGTFRASLFRHQETAGNAITVARNIKNPSGGNTHAPNFSASDKRHNIINLYNFLDSLAYHTSGVRSSVNRLFTLGSVRC
ncbi:MAG: hypothetical protein Q4B16_00885 [Bacteroidia bacterium]|nr:hypothetical protein [Bacteroidia bacterium]